MGDRPGRPQGAASFFVGIVGAFPGFVLACSNSLFCPPARCGPQTAMWITLVCRFVFSHPLANIEPVATHEWPCLRFLTPPLSQYPGVAHSVFLLHSCSSHRSIDSGTRARPMLRNDAFAQHPDVISFGQGVVWKSATRICTIMIAKPICPHQESNLGCRGHDATS